jgi:hypothetical protein
MDKQKNSTTKINDEKSSQTDLYNEVRPTSKSVRLAHTKPQIIDGSTSLVGNPDKLYYSKREYLRMRIRETQLTKELAQTFPKCNFAIDGVESFEYRVAKMERIQQARECVLKLQSLPDLAFVELYRKSSKLSSKLARKKGLYTENEVRKQ